MLILVLQLFTLDRNRGLWPFSGCPLMMMIIMGYILNSSKYNLLFTLFVDVLAAAAAYFETTVHQLSLWQTVSNHRSVEVGRTPRLGSSACLVLS